MTGILNDKYVLMCVSISVIILISVFLMPGENSDDETDDSIKGIVYDIDQTSRGYTFSFQDTEGRSIRCYFKEMPEESAYSISGNFSDDGSIFFVSEMTPIQSE